jgi:hypothetical protein
MEAEMNWKFHLIHLLEPDLKELFPPQMMKIQLMSHSGILVLPKRR